MRYRRSSGAKPAGAQVEVSRYRVGRTDELVFEFPEPLRDFYTLSPCVWEETGIYHLLLRVVNRGPAVQKISRIHYGAGVSALHFVLDEQPTIAPGPDDDDRDGCEDPSLAAQDHEYYVYYTGWNQQTLTGQLLYATGTDIRRLSKRGRVFSDATGFRNAKEATIVRDADGVWRLFFEFAQDDKSKIGVASSKSLAGPWTFGAPPFHARPDSWDSWHLSTGPVSLLDPRRPVMFYNGSDQDARWSIGWVEFDDCFTTVTARCEQPIIMPPQKRADPKDTDIAFAASAVEEDDEIGLYYTIADRVVMRTMLKPYG